MVDIPIIFHIAVTYSGRKNNKFLGFNGSAGNQNSTSNSFVSDSNFSSVFGASEPVGKLFSFIRFCNKFYC